MTGIEFAFGVGIGLGVAGVVGLASTKFAQRRIRRPDAFLAGWAVLCLGAVRAGAIVVVVASAIATFGGVS
jgi:hypothetical protein